MTKENFIKTPEHIGIIINGTEEWSKERNLPLIDGIKTSYSKIRKIPEYLFDNGVKTVSFYVFGKDIWNEDRAKVNEYMKITRDEIAKSSKRFIEKGYRIFFSGDISELPGDIGDFCLNIQSETAINKNGTINLCLNYDPEEEIVMAIKRILKNNITGDQVHKGVINKYIYNGGLGKIDLLIQNTEKSNIKGASIWQTHSAELFFLNKFWPDFENTDCKIILEKYNKQIS